MVSEAQRALLVRRVLAGAPLDGLAASARFGGFADELLRTLGELESGLLDPDELAGDLAALYAAYRAELDRLGLWDRDLLRRARPSACSPTSAPGTASPSSRTASRI